MTWRSARSERSATRKGSMYLGFSRTFREETGATQNAMSTTKNAWMLQIVPEKERQRGIIFAKAASSCRGESRLTSARNTASSKSTLANAASAEADLAVKVHRMAGRKRDVAALTAPSTARNTNPQPLRMRARDAGDAPAKDRAEVVAVA